MGGGDVGGLVTPDCAGAEGDLDKKKSEPKSAEPAQKNQRLSFPDSAGTSDDQTGNEKGDEAMRHLQPDLRGRDIGQATAIAPMVDCRKRLRSGVRNPSSIGRGKIEQRQVLVLMSHGRA